MTVTADSFDDFVRAQKPPDETVAYTDGGCRSNPGPAGYGVVVQHRGQVVTLRGTVPHATTMEAEYHGLLACLRWAVHQQITQLVVRMDSEVVVRQMQGRYATRNNLRPLYLEACGHVLNIGRVEFQHIPRAQNALADRLANEAMDAAGFPRATRGPKPTCPPPSEDLSALFDSRPPRPSRSVPQT